VIAPGLPNKLADDVTTARKQLETHEPALSIPRVAFLIINLDHAIGELLENRQAIAAFLDNFNDGLFQVAYQLRCA